jgi:hypothetical protein
MALIMTPKGERKAHACANALLTPTDYAAEFASGLNLKQRSGRETLFKESGGSEQS